MTKKKRINTPTAHNTSSAPMIIDLANYTTPIISEDKQKSWVNYGSDNNYFEYLLDRFRGSPTNNAIITSISDSIVGNGFTSVSQKKNPQSFAKAKLLFKDDNLKRWAFDLKCFGFYVQIIIMQKNMNGIAAIDYTAVQNWRSGIADDDGDIAEMWYSDDWTQANKPEYRPKSYPVYDPNNPRPESIYVVKPYRSGSFYYPSVDYQGALQYSQIEEEISNFHLNNIMNAFVPSVIINMNNGDPGEEQRKKIEANIKNKLTGSSSAGKFILAFNDDKDRATTVEVLQPSDLDKQFQFLSEESVKKIMVGHRVTSPLFFGIRDSSGLGSNADEIKNAWLLYENTVLKPYRNLMSKNMEYLLEQNGTPLPISFISNTPIEFKDETTDTNMNTHLEEHNDLDEFLELGEDIDNEEWELVDERKVDYDFDDSLDIRVDLADAVSGNARATSKQDTKLFKVRYEYSPKKTSADSREFCTKMVKTKKVYRKEDIQFAANKKVNAGWGPKGADTYDIWLYKGGGDCHHYWMRKTYLRRNNKSISVNEAKRIINALPPDEKKDAKLPVNDPKVAKRPTDMPNNGFLPSNKRKAK